MRITEKFHSDERGMMVVEAAISFTAFLLVCLTIVFMINIFIVHNRVQFALNSAAHEIASYTYLYDALGIRAASKQYGQDSDKYTEEIDVAVNDVFDVVNNLKGTFDAYDSTKQSIQDFSFDEQSFNNIQASLDQMTKSGQDTIESGKVAMGSIKNMFDDPNELIAGLIYVAGDALNYAAKHLVGMGAAWALTEKYIDDNADGYLSSYGVIDGYSGLDFSGSSVFLDSEERLIDLVVEYDIDLGFASFILPGMKIHVVQRAAVGAWIGGDDYTCDKQGNVSKPT